MIVTTDPAAFPRFWLAPLFPSYVEIERADFRARAPRRRARGGRLRDLGQTRLAETRRFSRETALAKLRGRYGSTFDLLPRGGIRGRPRACERRVTRPGRVRPRAGDRGGQTVIDRDRLWTGDLNRRALEPQPHVVVGLYDTTLRDGEQTVGVVLTPEDKLEIARALDEAGVDRIEAGFPRVSEDDSRRSRLIAEAGAPGRDLGLLARVQADVEALLELGVTARVIESPISDGKLRRSACRARRCSTASARPSRSRRVRHPGRLLRRGRQPRRPRVLRRVRDGGRGGRAEVVVVDTLGIATPEAAAYLVGETAEWLGHDADPLARPRRLRPATAAAVAAVQAGASWVHGTVNGMGERAGNADLLEVALALEALYGVPTHLRLEQASRAARRWWSVSPGRRSRRGSRSPGRTCSYRESGASRRSSTTRRRSSRTRRSSSAPSADSCSEEERTRLDPDQVRPSSESTCRRDRPRRWPSLVDARQAARRSQEARPRDRRGVVRRIVPERVVAYELTECHGLGMIARPGARQ